MRQIVWKALTWSALACLAIMPAQAASFDCAKARTQVEKLICGDPELSKLDEDLDQAYRQALQRPDVKQGIAESQRQWLKRERNACRDAACLKKAYQNRMNELSPGSSFGIVMMRVPPGQMPPPAPAKPAAPPPKPAPMAVPHPRPSVHPAVCDAVLQNTDTNSSGYLDYLNGGPVQFEVGGKKETAYITQEGSAHVDYLQLEDAGGQPIDIEWNSDDANLALAKFDGKIYIVASDSMKFLYVATIDKDNDVTTVCEFGYDKPPVETITESHGDKLCKLGLERKLDYVVFDQSLSLPNNGSMYPDGDAASVDIDNDGKPDFVFNYGGLLPGTGGCMGKALGVANQAHDEVDWSITDELPAPECVPQTQRPFTYKGQAYIEIRYDDNLQSDVHRIVQLKNGKLSTICNYSVRLKQHVLGDYERIIANAKAAYKDPWDYALEQPGTDAIQALLDAGQDLRVTPGQGAFGTALHEAIRKKRYDALRFLLEHGADPNLHSEYPFDEPPLIFAVKMNAPEAVKLLMAHGADPNRTSFGQTALQHVDSSIKSAPEQEAMRKLLTGR